MNESNPSALKEWAATEQALGTGAVTLLLRKGGIYEQREGFQVEHREFWLFPTLYHQNPDELRPELAYLLEAARAAHPDANRVRFQHYAVVEDALRVESLDAVERLESLNSLTADAVRRRFAYKNRPYLHALILRVYQRPTPHVLPNTLGYEGCVSWVDLDEEMSTGGAIPVLDDADFAARRADILGRLGEVGVTRL